MGTNERQCDRLCSTVQTLRRATAREVRTAQHENKPSPLPSPTLPCRNQVVPSVIELFKYCTGMHIAFLLADKRASISPFQPIFTVNVRTGIKRFFLHTSDHRSVSSAWQSTVCGMTRPIRLTHTTYSPLRSSSLCSITFAGHKSRHFMTWKKKKFGKKTPVKTSGAALPKERVSQLK